MLHRETDRMRRSVGAVCDRDTDRIYGAVGLCVTERWRESEERWGCV